MHIHLPDSIYVQIIQYHQHHLPEEACGALLGIQHSNSMTIDIQQFIPLSSIAFNRKLEFRIDEREWTQLIFKVLASGQQILGLIHSHPRTPAAPSFTDLDTLWHTIPTQWIISFADMNNPVLKAFSFHIDGTYENINWRIKNKN